MNNWEEIEETLENLDLALAEAKRRGAAWAAANAHYYSVKAEAVYRLRTEGMPATLIASAVKGEPEVNAALEERDRLEVEYDNAREARNVYKKKLDTLREEREREWNRSGMSD